MWYFFLLWCYGIVFLQYFWSVLPRRSPHRHFTHVWQVLMVIIATPITFYHWLLTVCYSNNDGPLLLMNVFLIWKIIKSNNNVHCCNVFDSTQVTWLFDLKKNVFAILKCVQFSFFSAHWIVDNLQWAKTDSLSPAQHKLQNAMKWNEMSDNSYEFIT